MKYHKDFELEMTESERHYLELKEQQDLLICCSNELNLILYLLPEYSYSFACSATEDNQLTFRIFLNELSFEHSTKNSAIENLNAFSKDLLFLSFYFAGTISDFRILRLIQKKFEEIKSIYSKYLSLYEAL